MGGITADFNNKPCISSFTWAYINQIIKFACAVSQIIISYGKSCCVSISVCVLFHF